MNSMRILYLIFILQISTLSHAQSLGTHNVRAIIEKVYSLIEDKRYDEGYKLLQNINESQTIEYGDSCTMLYDYEMGSCLYFLDRYQEAIPYLKNALLNMEKLPHEDCIYLELIYGIGSCYNKLKQYHNAEKYFRRVMIRGNVLGFKCMITTQTLTELTEVYNKLGYTKLAKECAAKINTKTEDLPSESWSNRVDGLLDLAESYNELGKFDEEINTYHKVLDLIESNVGKTNEDYLLCASLLRYRLLSQDRQEEAIEILKEMIDIGRSYKVRNENVCSAYEDYLEIMAKQNKVEFVEKMLPEAVEYIQHTNEYDWQKHNLYEKIGNAFAEVGNYKSGINYLEMLWNGSPSNSMRSISNLGVCYYFKPDYQKSVSYLKKAEGLINDSTNNVTKKVIYSYLNTAYSNVQNYAEAIKYAELVAPYIKQIDGEDIYAEHLTMWAIDCGNVHQFHKAQRLFEEAKGLFSIVSDNAKVTYYYRYGFYLIKTNESSKATDVLKNGVKLCVDSFGEDYVLLTTMYHNLGRAYMLQQDYSNALLYLNKSKDLQIKLNGKAMQRTLDYIKECESK